MQRAFGRAIARPLLFEDGESGDYSIDIESYDIALLGDIRPRGPASSAERLGIYNQQYWFRLLTIMQEEYPLTEHLLGTLELNKLSMAYLSALPPRSYSLQHLSDRLGSYLAGEHRWGRPLIQEGARLDYLFIRAFDSPALPALDPSLLGQAKSAEILARPLRLQPHCFPFKESWNLVECRRRVVRSGDTEVLPEPCEGAWVIYRNATRGVLAHRVGPLEHRLVELLHGGAPLGDACDALIESLDDTSVAEVAAGIQSWFASFVTSGWLVHPDWIDK